MQKNNVGVNTRRLAILSLSVAFAMLLSYVESITPPIVPLPGVKLGLANVATVFVMTALGKRAALLVSIVRIALTSMLFGSPVSAFYSLLGALLSFAVMILLLYIPAFSLIGVSVGGGVFHNVGQIIAASIILGGGEVFIYLPPLIISGVVAGTFVGILSAFVLRRLRGYINNINC